MSEPNQPSVQIASGDALDVRRFSVKQVINELFSIEVLAVSANGDIDFDQVIGAPASFALWSSRWSPKWSGICSEARQVRWESSGLSTYRMVIEPRAWLMTQRKNYRIFQMMSELDIVQQMLGEAGVSLTTRVDVSQHVPRKYRVQYAESDFAFISRMMEDAGINYYFETQGEETVMVLDDAPESRGLDRAGLRFLDEPDPGVAFATKLAVIQRVRPGRATIGDLDYRRPSDAQPSFSAAAGLGVEQPLEQFHYEPGAALYKSDAASGSTPAADDRGASRTSPALGTAKTESRLYGARSTSKQVQLATNAIDLSPGVIATVLDHPHRAVAGQALLVVGATIEGEHNDIWNADVTLAPTDAPYRPEHRTPRPKVQGLESATVVGPEGEEIHTDEYGRIRVHFHWDREGKRSEEDSCWIASSQPWAGAGFGGINLPRVGQEVLVEFLGGDPDRPIVIGRVFTETQPLPYKLPKYKVVSGIRSETYPRLMAGAADGLSGLTGSPAGLFPGGAPYSSSEVADLATQDGPFKAESPNGSAHGWSGSELSFDDTHGKQIAYFQAERNAHSLVKNAKTTVIGNSRAATIGTDDQLNVDNAQKIDVGSSQTVTIGGDRSWTIGGSVTQNVTHNYTLLTNDSIVHATDGRIDHYAQGNILIHSDTKITLKVGASSITITPDNITIQSGDRVDINPMQGSPEYQEKRAADEKAAKRAAAQQKIANATGAEKEAYDKAKAFQDRRGQPGTPQRWNEFTDAADSNGAPGSDAAWNNYTTANGLDAHTGEPVP